MISAIAIALPVRDDLFMLSLGWKTIREILDILHRDINLTSSCGLRPHLSGGVFARCLRLPSGI